MKILDTLKIVLMILSIVELVELAITLTPQVSYACAGERIELTCTATETAALQWIISVPGHTSENGIISSTQSVSTISIQISSDLIFILSRISTAPLTSTLSIRSSPPLNATLIRCSAGNSGTDVALIITTNIGTPRPFQLSIRSSIFGENAVCIHLQWVQSLNRGNTVYSLESEPPVDELLISDTNVLIYIPYNVKHNVTITARNCEGSTSASINIYFGKCGYPEVNRDIILEHYSIPALNGSTITFQCHPGYIVNGPLGATCNSSGDWNPDPRNTECVADCGAPSSNGLVSLSYSSTTAGSRVEYWCKVGLFPNAVMTSECQANKSWVPNPALLVCTNTPYLYRQARCSFPLPPYNGAITNFSDTVEGAVVMFQCNADFVPTEEMTSRCLSNGSWEINPISIRCTAIKTSDTEAIKIALSAIISAIICFVFGLFFGLMCLHFYPKCHLRWKQSSSSNNERSAPPDPLYEEVDVSTRQHITLNLNKNISYAIKHKK